MNAETFNFILPLLSVYCAVVALVVYLMLKVPSQYKLKWLAVPVLLVSSFFSYYVYMDKLGRPLPTELSDQEFVLVAGRVVGKKEAIEIWTLENRRYSRLIRIPYDEKTAKELQKALERGQKGVPQMGRLNKKKGNQKHGTDENDPTIIFYDYPHLREMPKTDQTTPAGSPPSP